MMNLKVIQHTILFTLLTSTFALTGCTSRTSEQATTPTGGSAVTSTHENSIAQEGGAEAYFQRLISQYGEDCTECLQPLELQVRGTPLPEGSSQEKGPLNVLVALDSSGSMAESVVGGTKMNLAKTAIARFVSQLPNTTQVGLLVYGHKGSSQAADQAVSCAGIDSVYSLSSLNRNRFDAAVRSFQPTGYTPIAKALEQAGRVLPADREQQNVVYLVSDGIETCGGNPVAAAQKLHTQADVIINVIGFDVNNEAQRQLEAVARAGGGKYLSARNGSELNRIFEQSRSQIQQTAYRSQNSIDRTTATGKTSITTTRFSSCVNIKLTREATRINSALTLLRPDDPNFPYIAETQSKLQARQTAIREWSDRVQDGYAKQRDVTLEQLKRDLESVELQFGQKKP